MKHKLKKILLLFLFTGMLFVSCTTEEDVVRNENYKSKFQIREQSYQELIKVNTFKRALDKIPKQKTSTTLNSKTVMEEQYGFSIIDTPIKITETDETIAYNLLVKSDTITEGDYFENLLINIDKQTNLIKAYLVKYNLEDTNLVYTNHNSFLFNGTRSAREVVYNNNPTRVFGKEVFGPCISYQILMCSYQGLHVAGVECIRENFDLLSVQTQTSGDCSNGLDPIDTSGGVGGTTSSGGTTSNGNTNDDSTTVVDNPTPPCTDCLELTPELDSFLGNLDADQFAIWNNLEYVVKRSIVSYLKQNNYSSESVAFVKDSLIALNEGGEIDIYNNIIYLIDKPCQSQIVKDILNTTSPLTDLINQTFNTNNKVNVKFTNVDIPDNDSDGFPDGNAYTNPFYYGTSSNFTINISFDNTFLESSTNLGIVATTLHELIHAQLIQLYIKGELISTNTEYNNLLNAFMAFYESAQEDTFTTLDNEIHNAMIDFIEKIGNSIYNYAVSKGINVTPLYCVNLAWGTMSGTQLFSDVLSPSQQILTNNLFAYEQDNMPSAQGDPCN